MTVDEIEKVCCYISATEQECKDAFPLDGETTVGSVDNDIATKLLSFGLGATCEKSISDKDVLYLIGCEASDCINIGNQLIYYDMLKSKQELIDYFISHSPTERSLAEFCADYAERYQNSLYWHYPISDTVHLGAYVVLVKEGVLYVPYDDADKVSCELFCLDAIKLLDCNDVFDIERSFEDNAKRFLDNIRVLRTYLAEK